LDFESGGVTVNVQGAATDGHPVLYDIFYLVQYLLDIKGKFIPPVIEDHFLTKIAITSKLILDALRVLGIKL